ncbi:hypothetical protein [Nocardia terpenica]|uniref:ATP/GTP-binding protein n=1 Tax=Nocardia terpenica TaxID=455432 RepID=A0A6G9ZDX0_9NOCA|nr:hypothetical protein [Nocardia terpenica]QIS23644.1 hypothetical protein F6W96_40625 [Nocardia terpenica]
MGRLMYWPRRWVQDRVLRSYEPRPVKPVAPRTDALAEARRRRRATDRADRRAELAQYRAEQRARDPSRTEPAWRRAYRLTDRGLEGPGGGAMGVIDPPPRFRATSVQACGMFPWLLGDTHPMIGTPLGRNLLTSGTFCYDPVSAAYVSRVQNTPSLFVLGLPTLGKSSLSRKLVLGEIAAGRTPFVFSDTKGEYRALIAALGGKVIRLGHGHGRLNPLAVGALGSIVPRLRAAGRDDLAAQVTAEVHARRKRLVQSLCEIERGETLTQIERNVLNVALRMLDGDPRFGPAAAPLITDLVELIESAPPQLLRTARVGDRQIYAQEVRGLQATLDALLDGEFGSVFAGHSTTPLDLSESVPIGICVDISAVSASDDKLIGAIMLACWEDGFGAIEAAHVLAEAGLAPQRNFLAVLDELWRVLNAGPGMVEAVNGTTRLTRLLGTALLMITHTVKDLRSLASESDIKKAEGFIERAGALIVGGLPSQEMQALDGIIPFTTADLQMVASWSTPGMYDPATGTHTASPGRGRFLLKIGTDRVPGVPFETVFTAIENEKGWHDTDSRFSGMRH